MKGRAALIVLVLLTAVGIAHSQAYSPVVQMTVTLPDGQTKTLSAPESGLTLLHSRTVPNTDSGRPLLMTSHGRMWLSRFLRSARRANTLGTSVKSI